MKSISRRDFLKGAAAGAVVGVATLGLGGCASGTTSSETSSPAPTEAAAEPTAAPAITTAAGAVDLDSMQYNTAISWLEDKPEITDDMISETKDYDIVVLGCGHAGAQVAVSALQAGGVTVAVLEKQASEDFSENGSEVGVFNSEYLNNRFGLEKADTGAVIYEFMKRANGCVNGKLISKYVKNSGKAFDNYISILEETDEGQELLADDALFLHMNISDTDGNRDPGMYPTTSGDYHTWAGTAMFKKPGAQVGRDHNGGPMLECMNNKAKELGADYYYGCPGVVLVQNDAGDVTGVIGQDEGGNYIRFNAAKGVAVCTGGFAGNGPMCWALLDEIAEWSIMTGATYSDTMASWVGVSGRDGSGLKMCCWAGGRMEPSPRGCMGALGGGASGPWGAVPMAQFNAEGNRFCNEAAFQTLHGICARQPFGMIALVTDTQYLKSIATAGVEHGGPNFGRPEFFTDMVADMDAAVEAAKTGETTAGIRAATVGFGNAKDITMAMTLDELADLIGYEGEAKEAFLASVKHYNELCYNGVDEDFGKDAKFMVPIDQAPFFASVAQNSGATSVGLVTLTGLITDENMNVVDKDQTPIKGLYVAGNTMGGRYGPGYTTPVAGNSMGMAITHGWLLGQYMVNL